MKAKRKLANNQIESHGGELFEVIERLKREGKAIASIERVNGSNSGWIVNWFRLKPPLQGAEFPREKQEEFFPVSRGTSQG